VRALNEERKREERKRKKETRREEFAIMIVLICYVANGNK
jgi:hypothetical protein